jgi:hypothetical protein
MSSAFIGVKPESYHGLKSVSNLDKLNLSEELIPAILELALACIIRESGTPNSFF